MLSNNYEETFGDSESNEAMKEACISQLKIEVLQVNVTIKLFCTIKQVLISWNN